MKQMEIRVKMRQTDLKVKLKVLPKNLKDKKFFFELEN